MRDRQPPEKKSDRQWINKNCGKGATHVFSNKQLSNEVERDAGAPAVFTWPEPELQCNFPALAGASK